MGWFSSHACWFNTSAGGDWTAAKMYMDVRRKSNYRYDDKCAFITLGIPTAQGATGASDKMEGRAWSVKLNSLPALLLSRIALTQYAFDSAPHPTLI